MPPSVLSPLFASPLRWKGLRCKVRRWGKEECTNWKIVFVFYCGPGHPSWFLARITVYTCLQSTPHSSQPVTPASHLPSPGSISTPALQSLFISYNKSTSKDLPVVPPVSCIYAPVMCLTVLDSKSYSSLECRSFSIQTNGLVPSSSCQMIWNNAD